MLTTMVSPSTTRTRVTLRAVGEGEGCVAAAPSSDKAPVEVVVEEESVESAAADAGVEAASAATAPVDDGEPDDAGTSDDATPPIDAGDVVTVVKTAAVETAAELSGPPAAPGAAEPQPATATASRTRQETRTRLDSHRVRARPTLDGAEAGTGRRGE